MSGSGDKKQLGKILLKQRLVTQDELDGLLAEQRRNPGERLASTAGRTGRVANVDLLKALSEQHGLPGIDLEQVVMPLENLDLVPAEIAKRHLILPILVKEERLSLAMADPGDRRVIDEIEFVSGRRVYPYVALNNALVDVIDRVYAMKERGEEHFIGASVAADYLESIGLEEEAKVRRVAAQPAVPARTASSGGVVQPALSSPPMAASEDDDLGLAELEARQKSGGFAEGMPAVQAAPRQRPANPKILVVDDEDDIRKLLQRVLTQKGFTVVEAKKGLEALQKVRDESPDVILLAAMLPEVHGFDICRRIKGSKRYGHIPIIMVSAIYRGWRVAEDLRESYGVEAFLEKPFKIGDVIMHVERALSGAGDAPVEDDEVLGKEASAYLEDGMAAYRNGDLDAAIAKLREGLSIDPLSFQLHYHLGLLWGRRDNVFDAIHELETAVDLQPKNFSALKNLAVLYQRAGFKHKAVEMWERALGNAPDDDTRSGIKEHLMGML